MNQADAIVIASETGISIRTFADISDLICALFDAVGLLLIEEDFAPEFFDLKSGLAGELFQKLTNYRVRTAIVLPHPEVYGERFRELAYEHRSHSLIRFVSSTEEANVWLLGRS